MHRQPLENALAKADESLAGAESEFINGRYDNCANRSYYACFQAAIFALMRAGVTPSGAQDAWAHTFVQSRFVGDLISRRKLYPADLRDVLSRTLFVRQVADYKEQPVSETQASRAGRHARRFVEAIKTGGSR